MLSGNMTFQQMIEMTDEEILWSIYNLSSVRDISSTINGEVRFPPKQGLMSFYEMIETPIEQIQDPDYLRKRGDIWLEKDKTTFEDLMDMDIF